MFPNYGNRSHRPFMHYPGTAQWISTEDTSPMNSNHGFSSSGHVYGLSGEPSYSELPQWSPSPYTPYRPAYIGVPRPPFRHPQSFNPNPNFVPNYRPRPQRFSDRFPSYGQYAPIPRRRFPSQQAHRGHSDLTQPHVGATSSFQRTPVAPSSFPQNPSRGSRVQPRPRRGKQPRNAPRNTEADVHLDVNASDTKNGTGSTVRSDTPDTLSGSQVKAATLEQDIEAEHSNLREKLIDQLRNGTYQCMVCISRVRQRDQTWSCSTCFHIYHLSCIKLWADKCRKSTTDNRTSEVTDAPWRCPSCQTEYSDSGDTLSYFCFCRRVRNPEYHPAKTNIPHSCDEICGKFRSKNSQLADLIPGDTNVCTHPCTDLCHPGPCPPCIASVTLSCPCGRIKRSALCGDPAPGPCGRTCQKHLDNDETGSVRCTVGLHCCLSACHYGPCPPCGWILEADCFCGSEHLSVACGTNEARKLSINEDAMEKLKIAAAEFDSSLLESQVAHLQIPEESNGLSPNTDPSGSVVDEQQEESANLPITETSSLSSPPPASNSLPRPAPVSLGACFSCGKICGRPLTCGNHTCSAPCHAGECKPCALDPSRCLVCPCGRVALRKLVEVFSITLTESASKCLDTESKLILPSLSRPLAPARQVASGDVSGDRTSCTDPVPTCPNVCDRPHPICGHPCPEKCHIGPCPPCKRSLAIKCRCGRTSKELACVTFASMADDGSVELLCERQCNKKKVCGRHKCKKKCCELTVHPCTEICGRRLSCGQHNCEEQCHAGSCGTCWRGVIYTEITCRCGFSVLQPPQPCGSGPPECPRPCDRPHPCEHPVRHTCHNDPTCPPCTVLLTKECPGGHGVQFSMPCFQPVLSCGRVCGHPLPYCSHTCQRNCHSGGCMEPANGETTAPVCTQPCQKPRPDCGHPCALPCHEAKGLTCLQASLAGSKRNNESGGSRAARLPRCRFPIEVVCPCGRRKEKQMCHQVQLKSCMLLQNVDPSLSSDAQKAALLNPSKKQSEPLPLLACDSTCTKAAEAASASCTNGRFADTLSWTRGLDLNPGQSLEDDTTAADKLPFEKPEYSKWMKNYALHNFAFAVGVERQFYSMVMQLLKASDADSVRSLTHHFPPMKEKRRRFIHELAEFYGIESHSMDPEPGRHVMVLARRGDTKFPGGAADHRGSLTAILQREFPGTVQLADGVRVPPKTEAKKHPLPTSTVRSSYAQILSTHTDPS